jgi:hypothetical protein
LTHTFIHRLYEWEPLAVGRRVFLLRAAGRAVQ